MPESGVAPAVAPGDFVLDAGLLLPADFGVVEADLLGLDRRPFNIDEDVF